MERWDEMENDIAYLHREYIKFFQTKKEAEDY
jgi:hypothetical protein